MKVQLVGFTTLLILVSGIFVGAILGAFNGLLAVILSLLVASLFRKRFLTAKELPQTTSEQDVQPSMA